MGFGGYDLDDIAEAVAKGEMQLWPAPKAAMVTEILRFPKRRALNTVLAGGNLEQIMDMVPSLRAFARGQGCDVLLMSGRPGWTRPLGRIGARQTSVTMEMEV